jgi:hypothetical protein
MVMVLWRYRATNYVKALDALPFCIRVIPLQKLPMARATNDIRPIKPSATAQRMQKPAEAGSCRGHIDGRAASNSSMRHSGR